jgi:1-deoxy-D-xylulose-5-phosphate synthase
VHDVALQGVAPVLAIDRAGLVGKDGPTHHGVFDIGYTRALPSFVVMAPKDGRELENMLELALQLDKPVAIRYPRAESEDLIPAASDERMEIGIPKACATEMRPHCWRWAVWFPLR